MKSVLLLSGGIDSSAALRVLKDEGHRIFALSLHYGQRHSKELEFAKRQADTLCEEHQTVDLSALQPLLAGSSQTSAIEVPEGHYSAENMKLTVVPNRNMIMLSIAIGWAVSLKADQVCYAAHAGDHHIYPDCRPEFAEKMDAVAQICDWHPVRLYRPFIHFSKAEIVKKAAALGVDFTQTWSCYKGLEKHCGRCGTCVERQEAFALAKIKDPTIYESDSAQNVS